MMKCNIFWFRRDLRLEDNVGLFHALGSGLPLLPLFIFDEDILKELPKEDARLSFIFESLKKMDEKLKERGSSILCKKGNPLDVWQELIQSFDIQRVYTNTDYEPYAIQRDLEIKNLLEQHGISFFSYKDQVIFERDEVVKDDGKPYTVFTPYKRKWLSHFHPDRLLALQSETIENFIQTSFEFPVLEDLGFQTSNIRVRAFDLSQLDAYDEIRDLPARDGTSYLSPHLRFGTISIREIMRRIGDRHPSFFSELIWREFFMQILWHFPKVVTQNFKAKYDGIPWRNDPQEFQAWCEGRTGYPMVDAGMRQLNQTGYMHNRVRMVVASFLCKHLLIDWRWGEAYFAKKLLDFELSSNNGNWQWAAGTGCDAAPYFRVFNPTSQMEKFDKGLHYVRKWVPEYGTPAYPLPIVEHKLGRQRAIDTYKLALSATK